MNKPAGLLSVPGKTRRGRDCVKARAREAFPGASGPLLPHRLDMDTSGLILVALDAEAHRDFCAQFEAGTIEKTYVAAVRGRPKADSGLIRLPIRPEDPGRTKQVVDLSHRRASITAWRVRRTLDSGSTLVELIPLTGRTHQLRIHCAAGLGLPIIGDSLYGGEPASRMMLHAERIAFTDPETSRRVSCRTRAEFEHAIA